MNEELTFAIDELRRRSINKTWLIPVKLNECEMSDRSMGGGETLRSLQWVELYTDWNDGISPDTLRSMPTAIAVAGALRADFDFWW
jgi:hypothetical protein